MLSFSEKLTIFQVKQLYITFISTLSKTLWSLFKTFQTELISSHFSQSYHASYSTVCFLLVSVSFSFFLRFIYYLFIYLFLAASGLSCRTWDLRWGMQYLPLRRTGFSLVVACGFSLSSCGARVPEHVGSVVCGTGALAEACRLGSCGTQA